MFTRHASNGAKRTIRRWVLGEVVTCTLRGMSLTSVLADRSSPLRTLLDSELPALADLRASYRALQPVPLPVVLPDPPSGSRPAYGTLGAAIDHRLRLALTDNCNFRDGGVGAGVRLTTSRALGLDSRTATAIRGAGEGVLDELDRLRVTLTPSDRSLPVRLPDADEEALCRACFVAAWFEEVYRTGKVWPGTPLGDAWPGLTADQLLTAVPTYAVNDLMTMAELAEAGLGPLRQGTDPADVIAGPTFAGSPDVGGADADWIADGLLSDVKATTKPATIGAEEIYQLAGYVLLDYDDEYRIDRVGWYLARAGWLVDWSVDEFFTLLGATRTIKELRLAMADATGST